MINFTSDPNTSPLDNIKRLVLNQCDSPELDKRHLLKPHLIALEKVAKTVYKLYPQADKEILSLAIWLHDTGIAWPVNGITEHPISGEIHARDLLSQLNYPQDKLIRVCHIVRSHANKPDYPPQTFEAQLFAAMDSASHFDCQIHLDIFTNGQVRNVIPQEQQTKHQKAKFALEKLERDWRDMAGFPDLQAQYQDEYVRLKTLFTNGLN